jgi:hypothetical protein
MSNIFETWLQLPNKTLAPIDSGVSFSLKDGTVLRILNQTFGSTGALNAFNVDVGNKIDVNTSWTNPETGVNHVVGVSTGISEHSTQNPIDVDFPNN